MANFYTGARVRWHSFENPHGLTLADAGEITAMLDTPEVAWVKFDKLDRSICVPLGKLMRITHDEEPS